MRPCIQMIVYARLPSASQYTLPCTVSLKLSPLEHICTSCEKIAVISMTSSCWLNLFSLKNMFIANLVRLVCIPCLFLYHPNFVRAPANSCLFSSYFLRILFSLHKSAILFSLHKSKEFHQCERALDYIQRNQWR